MTMPHQVEIIEKLVADAVQKAKVLVGGVRRPGGNFFAPTVLVDVDHTDGHHARRDVRPGHGDMRGARRPARHRAGQRHSVFGLGSTVFSKDQARAKRLADRLIAGSTCINDYRLA